MANQRTDIVVPGVDGIPNDTHRDVIGNKNDTTAGTSIISKLKSIIVDTTAIIASHLVPTADSADNVQMRDVIGNKTDTTAGNSIYANMLVPPADSAANVTMADVIGNKTDEHDGNSIYSKIESVEHHLHSESRCYPSEANAIAINSGAGLSTPWEAPGSFTEVVPVNTITTDFDIHFIAITAIASQSEEYELKLYSGLGGAEVFIGCTSFTKTAGNSSIGNQFFLTPILPANTRISAKLFTLSTTQRIGLTVKLLYHFYD